MKPARIAVPEPASGEPGYNQKTWPQYAHAIQSCGGVAVPIPLGESQASVAHTISGCTGVLLPGSPADVNPQKYGQSPDMECAPSDPERESVDELLLQDAFNLHKPILGICYGLQVLNVWRNGTLRQHLAGGFHRQSGLTVVHPIQVSTGSRLAAALARSHCAESTEIRVNSSHHQSVRIPGDGMQVVALSPDDGVIEGIELADSSQFVVGVQWHPERSFGTDALSQALFQSFVDAACEWRLHPIQESVVQTAEPYRR